MIKFHSHDNPHASMASLEGDSLIAESLLLPQASNGPHYPASAMGGLHRHRARSAPATRAQWSISESQLQTTRHWVELARKLSAPHGVMPATLATGDFDDGGGGYDEAPLDGSVPPPPDHHYHHHHHHTGGGGDDDSIVPHVDFGAWSCHFQSCLPQSLTHSTWSRCWLDATVLA